MSDNPYAAPLAGETIEEVAADWTLFSELAVAWRLYRQHWTSYVVAAVASAVLGVVLFVALGGVVLLLDKTVEQDVLGLSVLGLLFVFAAFLLTGMAALALAHRHGEEAGATLVFGVRRRFVPIALFTGTMIAELFLAAFVFVLFEVSGMRDATVESFVLAFILSLPPMATVMLMGLRALDARASLLRAVRYGLSAFGRQPMRIVAASFVSGALLVVGAITVVGIAIAWPVVTLAWAGIYVRVAET